MVQFCSHTSFFFFPVVTKLTTCSVIRCCTQQPSTSPRELWVISLVFDDAEAGTVRGDIGYDECMRV